MKYYVLTLGVLTLSMFSCHNASLKSKSKMLNMDQLAPSNARTYNISTSESKKEEPQLVGNKTWTVADNCEQEKESEEVYNAIIENEFLTSHEAPLSTFSIDVDNAAYSNMRRYVESGSLPPRDAVRIEEFINYFDYDYPQPEDNLPFSVTTELAACPWNAQHQLVLIGLQGKEIEMELAPASNLVFLVDVSGSMQDENKLPLVQNGLNMLVEQLDENDKVAIVTYAGNAGVALTSTSCSMKEKIHGAINSLMSGGSTNGEGGILKAYEIAQNSFITGGNNRVILCSDGDFNVGISSENELVKLIEKKRKSGVYFTTCGFGMGNYKDNTMEQLADHGNGAYFYIDGVQEAERVFVQGLRSTLYTIAKDVKIQVEFNPLAVESYRLIGYENRALENRDFEDDAIDAGDIGAGHSVTALYEITPAYDQTQLSNLKYQQTTVSSAAKQSGEMLTVQLRYKEPTAEKSQLISSTLKKENLTTSPSDNLKWASSVASFGMLLRDSKHKGNSTLESVKTLASGVSDAYTNPYKIEFLKLVAACNNFEMAKK